MAQDKVESKEEQSYRYHRLVVKLGTNLVTTPEGHLDLINMAALVRQITHLHHDGLETVLVSSGAIAAGRDRLGIHKEAREVPFRQVMAAVGQGRLMHIYEQFFAEHGITIAQALLTREDISDRAGYLNARNTIMGLLYFGVVPIVNENDVVAIDEIREAKFGDNDTLSALVANLVDADVLILLSDVAGLYTADPNLDPEARLIPLVEQIDRRIDELAGKTAGRWGTGGMATKIRSAKLATSSGVPVVLASGRMPDVVLRLARGEQTGTLFSAATSKLESRKRWLIGGLTCRGSLVIDMGAAAALKQGKGSLLPAGIIRVEGQFQRGDAVEIVDDRSRQVARGIVNYGSADVDAIKGAHSEDIASLLGYEFGAEVVHRDNLVIL